MVKKILIGILIVIILFAGFIAFNMLKGMGKFNPGNDSQFDVENVEPLENSPLDGKKVIYLGSSVTDGMQSGHVSFVEYIAKRDNVDYIKEAVSGTTLADQSDNSYVDRIQTVDPNYDADMVVVQLSTNDATKDMPLGEISDSKDIDSFDTSTTTGAIEFIIAYSQQTWDVPVMFYTGTYFDNEAYDQLVDRMHEIADKWGIGVIDMYNDEELNDITDEQREVYMNDGIIHPTKQGYLEWWTPVIEAGMAEYME